MAKVIEYPLSDSEVFLKVSEILNQVMTHGQESPSVQIRPESRLIAELGIDSLKIAEMSLLLEEKFKSSFFLPELFGSVEDPYLLTVQSLSQYVSRSLKEAAKEMI